MKIEFELNSRLSVWEERLRKELHPRNMPETLLDKSARQWVEEIEEAMAGLIKA